MVTAASPKDGTDFWDQPLDAMYHEVDGSPSGLSSAEAARRLQRHGANEVTQKQAGPLLEIARFFVNPLVLILLFAAIVSAVVGEYVNAILIAAIVLLSVALNFFQAYRSQQAARRLGSLVVARATALRDGSWVEIPRRDVVPGDVIRLAAGDLVPADARLLEAHDLFTDEAALTGESLPAEKSDVQAGGDHPLAEADTAVFLGTSVVSGAGVALVVRAGRSTEIGHIAQNLTARAPETEFERGTRRFGMLILRTVIFLVLFVFLVTAGIKHEPFLDSLLFAIALAVGLTPEFLPMIMSVTLARGALEMSKEKVIVKRLAAIENFGSMDILCSDKTGTLTSGTISLERYVDLEGHQAESVLLYAVLNGTFESGIKSPLDEAIVRHQHPAMSHYAKADEIPFDFTRRCSTVVVACDGTWELVTKGAPESVLARCTRFERDGTVSALDGAARRAAEDTFKSLSSQGYRVLAVGRRSVQQQSRYAPSDERDLILVGFAAFLDPPKEDAAETLGALRRDGVTVKIMTGDNQLVTKAVCRQVGLDTESMALGTQLDATSDDALGPLAERTMIFARVTPEQKNRVMRALRRRGHVVGFMGDGINDAPSLHNADVGISVDSAVDVAKEAAEIILLERSLKVLHRGVLEGRRSFGNIMKYIMMSTSSNFGNMFSMAGASLFLPFLPMLPIQILLNNLMYDVSQLTIPTDRVDNNYLQNPKRWNVGFIQRFMFIMGPVSSVYDFVTFGALIWLFNSSEELFHTGWFIESLATQTLVILVIRTAARPWQSRPSLPLLASVGGIVALTILLPYTALGSILGFVRPPLAFYPFLAAVVVTYLGLVEVVKEAFYRRYG